MGIISVGGGGGTSGGGSSSGIYTLNGETGPNITLNSSDSTIDISAASNIINLSCSGFISGVNSTLFGYINSQDLSLYQSIDSSGQILTNKIDGSGQYLLQEIRSGSGIVAINSERGPYITHESYDGSIAISVSTNNTIDHSCSGYAVPKEDCDWNGFPDRAESTISFDHSTRTFSIAPTGSTFDYYIECTKYTSSGDDLVISADEGVHYIYYDGSTLTEAVNPNFGQISQLIRTKAFVSLVYWGTAQSSGLYVGEERHGVSMSPVTHSYLHFQEGLRYTAGLGLNSITSDGDGDLDTSAVFGVDAGSVSDEDIYHAISAIGSGVGLPIYYWTGSTPNWNKVGPSGFAVRTFDGTSSTRLAYNEYTGGSWQLSEVDNNKFVLYHVFATTEKDNPIISIMGQDQYLTEPIAQEAARTEIFNIDINELTIPEFRPIATVIFKTADLYNNSVKAIIVATEEGADYIDWRNEVFDRVSVSTTEHNDLTGLQGGTTNQRYHLTESEYNGLPTKYVESFTNISSGHFVHNLNTTYVTCQVWGSGVFAEEVIPETKRVWDQNSVDLYFNTNSTGFVVITG